MSHSPAEKNQSVISNLSHDGRGVISNQGKKVLIDGVLPGEEVSWTYTKRHRRYDEAKVETVIKAADYRVPAICPNFLVCGGCSYQHISFSKQLEHKQAIVSELLEHVGKVKPKPKDWLSPLHAATSGYRTKARLGIRYVIKKQKILIGFREKSTHYITEMDTCKVLHPLLDNLLIPLSKLIASLSNYDQIPQIELAMGDELDNNAGILGSNRAVVLRHLTDFLASDKDLLCKFAQSNNINLLLQPNSQDIQVLYGTDQLFYQVNIKDKNGLEALIKYSFHPQNFTQVNFAINQLMLQQTMDLLNLSGQEKVLDLFCGLGNFTLPIAKILEPMGGRVLGIEGCPDMVQRAKSNAQLNNISNVSFESIDLYNEDKLSQNNGFVTSGNDWVILDPPRSGASQVLPYIAANNINKILYISCDPATFARDVGILCHEYGYKLHKVGIMDMFPHTKHVETMGLLKR